MPNLPLEKTAWIAFRDAFHQLEQAGVKVCLLRDDPAGLVDLCEVDVLVPRTRRRQTAEVLRNNGWKRRSVNRPGPGKEVYFRYYHRKVLLIDLHYEIIQNGLVYMDADWVLDTSILFRDGLVLPSNEAWLLHVIYHVLLGKTQLAYKYKERIEHVMQQRVNYDTICCEAKKHGLEGLTAIILAEPVNVLSDSTQVSSLRSRARKILLQVSILNRLRVAIRWFFEKTARWRRMYAGRTIAVIGVDGAGKSTFISALRCALDVAGRETRDAYMGPWDRHVLPTTKFLSRLGANPLDEITNTDRSNPMGIRVTKWIKGMTRRYLYYFNSVVEIWGRFIILVLPHQMRGRVVLMDRYYYDLEIGHKNKEVRNARRLRSVLVALAPKPHLTICLSADPVAIATRKGEDPLEDIMWAVEAYEALAARRGIKVIRTDDDIDYVLDQFLREHWKQIM